MLHLADIAMILSAGVIGELCLKNNLTNSLRKKKIHQTAIQSSRARFWWNAIREKSYSINQNKIKKNELNDGQLESSDGNNIEMFCRKNNEKFPVLQVFFFFVVVRFDLSRISSTLLKFFFFPIFFFSCPFAINFNHFFNFVSLSLSPLRPVIAKRFSMWNWWI